MTTALPIASRLRALELNDIDFVRRTMREHLGGGFFSSLGDRFLGEYLKTYATSPAGCALIAEVDGRPVGFLVGSVDAHAHRRHVLGFHRRRLLSAGLLGLATHPRAAIHFVRTRLRHYSSRVRSRTARKSLSGGMDSTGVLAHVAVVPEVRGQGLGLRLLIGFSDVCRAHGTGSLELVVRKSNTAAQRFYRRHGWAAVDVKKDTDGVEWVTMSKAASA